MKRVIPACDLLYLATKRNETKRNETKRNGTKQTELHPRASDVDVLCIEQFKFRLLEQFGRRFDDYSITRNCVSARANKLIRKQLTVGIYSRESDSDEMIRLKKT